MEAVSKAGFDPHRYISFWNLRSYDRINSPWDTIKAMEQNVGSNVDLVPYILLKSESRCLQSGVTFHQAQVALSRLWAGNPTEEMREKDETVILSRPHVCTRRAGARGTASPNEGLVSGSKHRHESCSPKANRQSGSSNALYGR